MKQQLKCGKSLKNIDAKFAISVPRDTYEAQLLMVAGDVSRVRAAPMWRRVSELK
jgi:hypothetical protein